MSDEIPETGNFKRRVHSTDDSKRLKTHSNILKFDFFNVSCEQLAKNLLGKVLVRKIDDEVLKGRIVETECYLGSEDKASHSYNGRRTERTEPMYMQAGTAYVYFTYGMYHCFNISSIEPGAVVLIRAVEPLEGSIVMDKFRHNNKCTKSLKPHELCNGPSKLCISFNITKSGCNKINLCDSDELWIEEDNCDSQQIIITSSRIGIQSAGDEWANKLLRFYLLGNTSVSKRDRVAEKIIKERLE